MTRFRALGVAGGIQGDESDVELQRVMRDDRRMAACGEGCCAGVRGDRKIQRVTDGWHYYRRMAGYGEGCCAGVKGRTTGFIIASLHVTRRKSNVIVLVRIFYCLSVCQSVRCKIYIEHVVIKYIWKHPHVNTSNSDDRFLFSVSTTYLFNCLLLQ